MHIHNIRIGCEIFLIQDDALLREKRKIVMGGSWALTGGYLKYDEPLLECTQRELIEELGIEGTELQLITAVDDINDQAHYLHISFFLKKFLGQIQK